MELEIYKKKKTLTLKKKPYRYEILDVEPAGRMSASARIYPEKKNKKKNKQKILELILNCIIRNVMRT